MEKRRGCADLPSAYSKPDSGVRTISKFSNHSVSPIVERIAKRDWMKTSRTVFFSPFASCPSVLKTPVLGI